MTRNELETIADSAIAEFIRLYWGHASMTPGMASTVDQSHKAAIDSTFQKYFKEVTK